jgi:PAS domain S-box-containing protein
VTTGSLSVDTEIDVGIEKQELASIIDTQALQTMMSDLYAVTKIGSALIDLKGNVLASAGWQDICIKFHRVNPQTNWNCLESDLVLTRGVNRGETRTYKCKNNMWDIVTPLIIGNRHVGNVFSGQFFYEDELIDRELFAKQAEKYGFEKDAYLAALDRVPRFDKKTVEKFIQFYVKLTEMIAKLSFTNLKLTKTLTNQKLIENNLKQSQHDLKHAQSVAKTGSWRLNVLTNDLVWSDETYLMFGISRNTVLTYDTFLGMVHADDREIVDQKWRAALRGEKYDVEHRILVNRKVCWVREKAELEFDSEGMLICAFGTVQDITEHKNDEERLQRLNRALRAISNANQALMRATDEIAFLQQGCRIIIEDCGYPLVWIGFARDDQGKTVEPMAYAGFDKGYIDSLKITWEDTERGRGPTGTAIRTQKIQVCNDIRSDPNFDPWRKQALERGYASSITLPLISKKKVYGAVNIYAQETNAFSKEEVKLLMELTNDFANGIITLRMRADNERAHKALKESEENLHHSNERLGLISEIANQLLSTMKPQELIQQIGQKIMTFLECDIFFNLLTDEKEEKLELNAFAGVTDQAARSFEKFGLEKTEQGEYILSQGISRIKVKRAKLLKSLKVKAYAEYPLISEGRIIGILSYGSKQKSAFTEEEFSFMKAVAAQVSVALERQRAEEALVKAREEWERTFDAIPELLAIIDYKNRILRVNSAMAKELGVTKEQCFGMKCYICIHGVEQPSDNCPHIMTVHDGKVHCEEVYSNKLKKNLLVTTTPLKNSQGKIIATMHLAKILKKES